MTAIIKPPITAGGNLVKTGAVISDGPALATDVEVTAAVAAEAALARNADNLTSGTVPDARIPAAIARDSEVTAALLVETNARIADVDAEEARAIAQESTKEAIGSLEITRYDSFERANGPVGISDSGHTYAVSGSNLPVVINGKLATPVDGTAFAQLDCGVAPIQYGAKFTFEAGAAGNSLMMGSSKESDLSITDQLHFIVSLTGWNFQYRVAGGAFLSFAQGTFVAPLTADGATEYELLIEIEGNTARVRLPDNNAIEVTDPLIGTLHGRYVIWEPTKTAGNAEPRFTSVWAATPSTNRPSSPYATKGRVAGMIARLTDRLRRTYANKGESTQVVIGTETVTGFAGISFGAAEDASIYRGGAGDLRTAGGFRTVAGGANQVFIGSLSGGGGMACGSALDAVVRRTAADLLQMGTGDSFAVDGTWNGGTYRLGTYRLWVDATGALRIKNGAPTSDLDGTALQPTDADLTEIAALNPSNDDLLQQKAGAWTNRTPAQVKTDLALVKGDVGLGNVDNTSDVAKPVSTAQAAADALLVPKTQTQAAETTVLPIFEVLPFTPGFAPFQVHEQSYANPGEGAGTYNHAVFFGFNAGRHSGGSVVAGKPAIIMGFEDHYYDDNGDEAFGVEWYIENWSPDGTTVQGLRPFYARILDNVNACSIRFDIGTHASGMFTVQKGATNVFQILPTLINCTVDTYVTSLYTNAGVVGYSGANRNLVLRAGLAAGTVSFLDGVAGAVNLTIADAGHITLRDAITIQCFGATGFKLGGASTHKIGFWGATAAVRPAAVADATGGAIIDAEARTAINTLMARLRTIGLLAA